MKISINTSCLSKIRNQRDDKSSKICHLQFVRHFFFMFILFVYFLKAFTPYVHHTGSNNLNDTNQI